MFTQIQFLDPAGVICHRESKLRRLSKRFISGAKLARLPAPTIHLARRRVLAPIFTKRHHEDSEQYQQEHCHDFMSKYTLANNVTGTSHKPKSLRLIPGFRKYERFNF